MHLRLLLLGIYGPFLTAAAVITRRAEAPSKGVFAHYMVLDHSWYSNVFEVFLTMNRLVE